MLGTSVPETTVHKHRHALFGKDEIRLDDGRACWPLSAVALAQADSAPHPFFLSPNPQSTIGNPQSNLPPPAGDALRPQQLRQCNFRLLVAASANPRHHFRALPLG